MLVQKSYFGGLLLETKGRWVNDRRVQGLRRQLDKGAQARIDVLNPFLVETGRSYPTYLVDNLLLEGGDIRTAWAVNRGILRDIKRQAAGGNALLLLSIFPSTVQVNRSHAKFYAGLGFRIDDRVFESDVPQRLLNVFCQEEAIVCYDLLPEFRRHQPKEFYRDDDDHLNQAGQTLAFSLVRDKLESLGWLR